LRYTFTRFVHCHLQRIMQFRGVVKVKNIEATDAGVTSVCDGTEVPSTQTEQAHLAAATQCQVRSVYSKQARSAAATQCQMPSVCAERAR